MTARFPSKLLRIGRALAFVDIASSASGLTVAARAGVVGLVVLFAASLAAGITCVLLYTRWIRAYDDGPERVRQDRTRR